MVSLRMKLPEDRKKFVELIEKGATVTKACQLLHIHRSTFYDWRNTDRDFCEQFMKAKSICNDETNDAASYHYHKWVREGDKKFVKKWLDQQHPEFVQKPLRVLLHKIGDHDSGLMSMDKEELFSLIRAYQHAGFEAVDTLDEKMKEEYLAWYLKHYPESNNNASQKQRWDTVTDIMNKTIEKRNEEE